MNHGVQWWTRLAPEVQAALVTAVATGVVALLGVAGTILAGIISTSRAQKAALHQFQLQAEREDRIRREAALREDTIRREQALQASRDAAREERKQAYARFLGLVWKVDAIKLGEDATPEERRRWNELREEITDVLEVLDLIAPAEIAKAGYKLFAELVGGRDVDFMDAAYRFKVLARKDLRGDRDESTETVNVCEAPDAPEQGSEPTSQT